MKCHIHNRSVTSITYRGKFSNYIFWSTKSHPFYILLDFIASGWCNVIHRNPTMYAVSQKRVTLIKHVYFPFSFLKKMCAQNDFFDSIISGLVKSKHTIQCIDKINIFQNCIVLSKDVTSITLELPKGFQMAKYMVYKCISFCSPLNEAFSVDFCPF